MMKSYRIELLQRVGDLRFGMAREDVRKSLGEYKEFKKGRSSINTTDDFKFCHAFYNAQNKLEAIEFFQGMDTKLALNSIGVFELEYEKLKNYVKDMDEDIKINPDGFISKKGISVYAPTGKTETVLLTSADYWD